MHDRTGRLDFYLSRTWDGPACTKVDGNPSDRSKPSHWPWNIRWQFRLWLGASLPVSSSSFGQGRNNCFRMGPGRRLWLRYGRDYGSLIRSHRLLVVSTNEREGAFWPSTKGELSIEPCANLHDKFDSVQAIRQLHIAIEIGKSVARKCRKELKCRYHHQDNAIRYYFDTRVWNVRGVPDAVTLWLKNVFLHRQLPTAETNQIKHASHLGVACIASFPR